MIPPKKGLKDIHRHPLSSQSRRPLLRLDMNENIGDLSPSIVREMLSGVDGNVLTSYPEYAPLYERLARKFSLDAGQFLLANGSDSASRLIFDTYVDRGDSVILTNPTFAMHKVYAEIAGARITEIPYKPDFSFPLDRLIDSISSETRLIILVTPNNPLGGTFSKEEIRRVARRASEMGALVFVDEAYVEFHGESAVGSVGEFENIIVTRTFSKAYGIPAARLGYAISRPENIENLRKSQPIFDVNQFAVELGCYLLDHPEILQQYLDQVAGGRAWLLEKLATLGLRYHAGRGNFVLIDVARDPEPIALGLRSRGILVSHRFTVPFLDTHIRCGLGPRSKMQVLAQALEECLHG